MTVELRAAARKALAVLDEIANAGFADDMDENGIPVTDTITALRAALVTDPRCPHADPHDADGCTATWVKDGETVRCGCLIAHDAPLAVA